MATARLIQGTNGNWYVSNGIHKRLLTTVGSETREEQAAQLILSGILDPANATPGPPMDQDTVNAIVTV